MYYLLMCALLVTSPHLKAGLIARLITNMTHRNEDPRLLEAVRREAVHRIMSHDRKIGK